MHEVFQLKNKKYKGGRDKSQTPDSQKSKNLNFSNSLDMLDFRLQLAVVHVWGE